MSAHHPKNRRSARTKKSCPTLSRQHNLPAIMRASILFRKAASPRRNPTTGIIIPEGNDKFDNFEIKLRKRDPISQQLVNHSATAVIVISQSHPLFPCGGAAASPRCISKGAALPGLVPARR